MISAERLARREPVRFDPGIVALVKNAARARGLVSKRRTSGAGHDAQMIARIAPAAMIFVPSIGGVSHSPREETRLADLVAGANVLLDVVARLAANPAYDIPAVEGDAPMPDPEDEQLLETPGGLRDPRHKAASQERIVR